MQTSGRMRGRELWLQKMASSGTTSLGCRGAGWLEQLQSVNTTSITRLLEGTDWTMNCLHSRGKATLSWRTAVPTHLSQLRSLHLESLPLIGSGSMGCISYRSISMSHGRGLVLLGIGIDSSAG
ncbi:unnamed protein product [Ixodes pacificus]